MRSALWSPVSPYSEASNPGGLHHGAQQHLCSHKILDVNVLSSSVLNSPILENKTKQKHKWLKAGTGRASFVLEKKKSVWRYIPEEKITNWAMDCLWCGETQDEEMFPEFEAGSLAEEWHNPFRWEVWGMAKVRVGLFMICHVYEASKSKKKTN